MRRFLAALAIALPLSFAASTVSAQSDAEVTVFVRDDCVHCRDLKQFLETRKDITTDLRDIAEPAHRETFEQLAHASGMPLATPLTFINGVVLSGFDTAATTGPVIDRAIDRARTAPQVTIDDYLRDPTAVKAEIHRTTGCDETGAVPCEEESLLVRIPFTSHTIDVQGYSLPLLALILGFIDGFNPCAMWVLVTFLIVLLQLGDRRRMFQVAGLFIIAETLMYYAILNVWFTTWDFIGLDRIVTPIVGMLALGSGIYFLYDAATNDGTCKVTSPEARKKAHHRIHALAASPLTILSAIGIIGLAFSVNIIEFACSIGIPQTFTKILEINGVETLARQGLMALYILGYMADDFIVFGVALAGADYLGLTHRYARISHIVGGVLMVGLGVLLLAAPGVLRSV